MRLLGGVGAALLFFSARAIADEEANSVFKRMSEFLVKQEALSAGFDATLDIVTADLMKVSFASSGALNLKRPDHVRVARKGGIADVELVYDGKVISAYGKNLNVFTRYSLEGKIDDAIDALRFEFELELPAADLLSSNPYESMMSNVVSSVALGTGVIRGQDCDHVAFRTAEVDWQIWVAQGDRPFPCRFTITSKLTIHSPSYSIEFHDWKSGPDVAADDFQLTTAADAKEVAIAEIGQLDDAPAPSAESKAQ